MEIVFDGKPAVFQEHDFPMLISGANGFGASRFTIVLMAQLFRQGYPIVFFSALPAAKEDFQKLLTPAELERVEVASPGMKPVGKQAVIISSGEETEFVRVVNALADAYDRVLLIKNVDQYSAAPYETAKRTGKFILSGDFDRVSFLVPPVQTFATTIFFSRPEAYPAEGIPPLEPYQGFAIRNGIEGFISLG